MIVVDDGSTDGTADALRQAHEDARLRIVSLPHGGRSAARNKGLEIAVGKWICFLDSDDIYSPALLERYRDDIAGHSTCKAFACEQAFDGVPRRYRNRAQGTPGYCFGFSDFIYDNPLSLNQLCFSNTLQLRFPDGIDYSEDWYFFRRLTLGTEIQKTAYLGVEVPDHSARSMHLVDAELLADHNYRSARQLTKDVTLQKTTEVKLMTYTGLLCANMVLSARGNKGEALRYFKASLGWRALLFANFYRAVFKLLFFR